MRRAVMGRFCRTAPKIQDKGVLPMSVFRIYVEKKPDFAVEARAVLKDLQTALRCNIFNVRIMNRYDVDHISEEA